MNRMPYLLIFYTFVLGLFTSLVQIPAISRLAVSIGILDEVDERKVHTGSIPRLGGFAIFFSVLLATILFGDIQRELRAYLAGGIIIFLTGLSDDLQALSPRQKFMGEFFASSVAIVLGGQSLTSLGNLFGYGEVSLGLFFLPFTIIALVGVINAVNLIDGLDGLAGGITAIASLGFLILAGLYENKDLMFITAALFGATIGFLKFNTHPAKIFMGDSGSLFLGYTLGFCAINLAVEGNGNLSPVLPLIVLALPIVDTIVVMVGRGRRGERFFAPDTSHLHHRLLALGISHRMVVAALYIASYCFALAAIIFRTAPDYILFYGLLTILAFGYLSLRVLEWQHARRGALKILSIKLPYLKLYHNPGLQKVYTGLLRGAKFLLVAVFGLTTFIPPIIKGDIGFVALFLLLFLGVMLCIRDDLHNRLPHFAIYFNGAFVIYLMQNYTADVKLLGTPLLLVSDVIFAVLFLVILVLATIRANPSVVLSTPLEYLIIFLVVSVPLLPESFRQHHDLMMVAGKSVILFVALKLVLKVRATRNRKIILAALLSLLIIALRNIFSV